MDFEQMAHDLYNRVRRPGSPQWIDLTLEVREWWMKVAEESQRDDDGGEYWCPACEERENEIEKLNEKIKELTK